MEIPLLTLPKPVPLQRMRAPQENIPQTRAERDALALLIKRYVAEVNPIPPMPVPELKEHADRIIERAGCDPKYRDYIGILINNEAWREQFRGKRYGASLKLNSEIQNISGATLSSRHITDGVKRLLATYALVCAQD